MKGRITLLATILGSIISTQALEPSRTWTDVKGREIEGKMIDYDSARGTVRVEIKAKVHVIKLDTLSEYDQEYVKENGKPAGILNLSAKSKAWGRTSTVIWQTSWGSSIKEYLSNRDVEVSINPVSTTRTIYTAIYFTGNRKVVQARARTDIVTQGQAFKCTVKSGKFEETIEDYVALGINKKSGERVRGWVVVFRDGSKDGDILEIVESVKGEKDKVKLD